MYGSGRSGIILRRVTSLEDATSDLRSLPALTAADTERQTSEPRRPACRRWPHGASLAVLAIVALGLVGAAIEQSPGPSQTSHFALVRALAAGTAEIGPGISIDSSYINDAYFANKAPGLAFTLLPAYVVLRAAGHQEPSRPYEARLWQLTLFGAVLPALVLLVLMLAVVEPVVRGYGALTAVLLGAGTMLLPLSTLLFGHLLSAALGFAAFVVLVHERRRGPSPWLSGAAGLLAGFAVVVEYPLGIVVLVLAAYVAFGDRLVRRLGTYAAGCVAGVAPLLAYNLWAFGSPTTLSYTNSITGFSANGGPPRLGSGNSTAFYGVALPDVRVVLSLLFSEKGLLVVAPVCLVALLGFPALWRSGRRAESFVCIAVPVLFLAYNAAYYIPFGGQGPGPRFLAPAIPFLALPLAFALRRHLSVALGLGLASVLVMGAATATNPLSGEEHSIDDWFRDLVDGRVVSTVVGPDGRAGLVAPALLLGVAFGLAVASARPRLASLRPGVVVAVALVAWLTTALAAPRLLPADAAHGTTPGALAVVLLLVAVPLGLAFIALRGAVVAVALAPLLLLVHPAVYTRQRAALLVVFASLALVAASGWWTRPRRPLPVAVEPASGPLYAEP